MMKFLHELSRRLPKSFEIDIKANHAYAQVEVYHIENFSRCLVAVIAHRKNQITISRNTNYLEKYGAMDAYRSIYLFLCVNMEFEGKKIVKLELNSREKFGRKPKMKEYEDKP